MNKRTCYCGSDNLKDRKIMAITVTKYGVSTLPPDVQAECDEITQETADLMTEAANRMLRKRKPGRPHTKGNPMPYSQRQLNRIRR